ncbi:hypothetical protein [Deinococcus sp.]|uniref:hypothetical protein n=1 Tax=Deinococcus sp. TaxID=47478 RepID=UPI003B5BCE24
MRYSSTFLPILGFCALLSSCGQQVTPQVANESGASGVIHQLDTWCGGKEGNGISATYYDSSVSSSQWGFNYVTTFDQARAQWGGISSRVALNKTSSTANNPDKYYVGNTAVADRLGITTPYIYKNGVLVDGSQNLDDVWAKANVSIYDNTFKQNSFTTTERLGTVTHELGHSLKLAHPGQGSCRVAPISAGATAVMVQGRKAYGVQQYDKQEIKAFWGL